MPCCEHSPLAKSLQVSIFENLEPELTQEHKELRRKGINAQQELLKTLLIRYGIQISSAIRSEMAVSGCTYEEACVRFVQACDHLTASFHYMDLGEASDEPGTVSDRDL